MTQNWLVVLPPFIVFFIFFMTKRIMFSLVCGLVGGAMIATDYQPYTSGCLISKHIVAQLVNPDKIAIYSFLLLIGVLVTLLTHTGGMASFTHHLSKRLYKKRMVETTSLLLSHSLFLEDYLSSLTVGNVMRPLADKFGISRTKLAFLVDAMAEPVAILMPISSWGAILISLLDQAGVSQSNLTETALIRADPMLVYVSSLPFIFYAVLVILSAWFIVWMNISYGPMKRRERATLLATEIATAPEEQNDHHTEHGSLIDLLIPLFTLIGGACLGFAYAGGYWLFGGSRGFIDALQHNNQTSYVLVVAVLIACMVGITSALLRKKITPRTAGKAIINACYIMKNPLIILILASALGGIFKDELRIGQYLASLLHHSFSISMLPCIFFIFSLLAACATCGSWSALPLVLPIAIPMLVTFSEIATPATPNQLPLLYPVLGAIFSGVLAGDHLSPISDTTIMASLSSGTEILEHFYTQFFYVLPAAIASFIGFLVAGMLHTKALWIMLAAGGGVACSLCLLMLLGINALSQWRSRRAKE